jgi:hypothetical protein
MKKIVLSCCLLLFVSSVSHAASKGEAVTIVKKYSELVACALPESDGGYSVVKVQAGSSDYEDDKNDGAGYLVHWMGDTGCHKGSGTVRSNYTIVADTFGSGPMLVTQNYVDAGFGVTVLKSITVQDDIVTIKGTIPGETKWDQKPVTYKLKNKWGKLTIVE